MRELNFAKIRAKDFFLIFRNDRFKFFKISMCGNVLSEKTLTWFSNIDEAMETVLAYYELLINKAEKNRFSVIIRDGSKFTGYSSRDYRQGAMTFILKNEGAKNFMVLKAMDLWIYRVYLGIYLVVQ